MGWFNRALFLILYILEASDRLKKLYSRRGSNVLFAKLSGDLAESFPENKLDRLKHDLTGKTQKLLLLYIYIYIQIQIFYCQIMAPKGIVSDIYKSIAIKYNIIDQQLKIPRDDA